MPLVAGRTAAGIGVVDGIPELGVARGARLAAAFAFAVPAVQVWAGFPELAGIEVAASVASLAGVAVSVVAEVVALVLSLAAVWSTPAEELA